MFAKAAITGTLQAGTTTFDAEYLVVAGGGGGAGSYGGGGAGGYRSSVTGESSGGGASAESALNIALGTPYTVTVGAGGSGGSALSFGSKGANSSLSTIVSEGGGFGAYDEANGGDGGSGGGASGGSSSPQTFGGSPISGQGYKGGDHLSQSSARGAGGGGAGEAGQDASNANTAGDGGNGIKSLITGSATYRAGGGGGASTTEIGAGGLGGGGDGSRTTTAEAGSANTGGGGGGGGYDGTHRPGGAGGSGVVIIRVPSEVVAEFSAGVVYNYIPLDDFNVYEITAAGVSDTVTFSQGAVTTVGESLRFNDDDSAYLSRTPASAGNRKTWTWSGWVKRGNLGSRQTLWSARDGTSGHTIELSSDQISIFETGTGVVMTLLTDAVFRDVSAWYHIVFEVDTTQATSSNRFKIYVNGTQIIDFATAAYPALNADLEWNNTKEHDLGRRSDNVFYFDGYMSDVYFIDGEALDPSRFGKQDADGIWQPISYTGSYGTNGFHLDFADNSTAAALGTDTSGNGNDWTPSGITTDDQVTDTPTVNYATLNSIDKDNNATLSEGNLKVASNGAGNSPATFFLTSGKWYWEAQGTGYATGVAGEDGKNYAGSISATGSKSIGHWSGDGRIYWDGGSAAGATYTASDVMAVALDMDAGTVAFYKNNTVVYTATFGSGTVPDLSAGVFPVHNNGDANSRSVTYNFGQRPFAYTPPTGFQALNSSNLPAPTITDGKEHFQPVLYTGNGTSQTVRGLEFQPDFVWFKSRTSTAWHLLVDAVRGNTKGLASNVTDSEYTTVPLLTFLSNGIEVNHTGTWGSLNSSGNNIVAWNWNAGGSTVTNTDGTITSQVRANTTAGFSIVSYTGNSTENTTYSVGHGLSQTPDMVIVKNRDWASSSKAWAVWHSAISTSGIYLDNTDLAEAANYNYFWASQPTSSTFSVRADSAVSSGNRYRTNGNYNYIAYCFAGVDGFSKFGTYTGNGSANGPFVYTGFRPAFVLVKITSSSSERWWMHDSKREPYNGTIAALAPDDAGAEQTGSVYQLDMLSNGFKLRNAHPVQNASGGTYIYMAFAENPFKTARAR